MKERNKFFVLLLVLLLAAATYYWFSTDHTKEMVLIGIVDANQVVVSSRIAGRIDKLVVDEGTQVKAGDLIAELDSAELNAQKQASAATIASFRSKVTESQANEAMSKGETASSVVNAQAKLRAANFQLEEAKANLQRLQVDDQRTQSLAASGVASKQDADRSQQQVRAQQAAVAALNDEVRAAEADVKVALARTHQAHAAQSEVASTRSQAANAQAQLVEAETRLGYTRIDAPVSGTISVRVARQGEVVNVGSPIVTIVDLNDSWVRAAMPEIYADRIALGDALKVRLPSGAIIDGKVIFKSAESDFATERDVSNKKRDIRTVVLKVRVDNSQKKLVPGMTAEVLVPKSMLAAKPGESVRN